MLEKTWEALINEILADLKGCPYAWGAQGVESNPLKPVPGVSFWLLFLVGWLKKWHLFFEMYIYIYICRGGDFGRYIGTFNHETKIAKHIYIITISMT